MHLRHWLRPTHPFQLAAGLTLWAVWFIAVYSGLSLACRWVPPAPAAGPLNGINATIGLLTLLTTVVLLVNARRCWQALAAGREPAPQRFIAAVSLGLYLAAAIATLAVGAPATSLPPCL